MSYDDSYDEELDLTPPPVGSQYHPAETEDILLTLRETIENARPVPLSASSMISKEDVIALIDDALESLPEELRAARWLLKEREDFLARTRHQAQEIIEEARMQAERMVQRTEVVKAAEQRAYEIVDAAEADARRLQHEVEDFCDQKLASFEIVLERTMKLVGAGRAKLQGTNLLAEAAAAHAPTSSPDDPIVAPLGGSGGVYDELSQLEAPSSAPNFYDEDAGGTVHQMERRPQPAPAPQSYGSSSAAYSNDYDDDFDDEYDDDYDDYNDYEDGQLQFEKPQRPRLTVVDDRYSTLPPPPASSSPESTFFDQDLS